MKISITFEEEEWIEATFQVLRNGTWRTDMAIAVFLLYAWGDSSSEREARRLLTPERVEQLMELVLNMEGVWESQRNHKDEK